jgi:ribosomal-protein-alanine N-acetyltransferase
MDVPYRIRAAEPSDVPGMLEVERSSFGDPWSSRAIREAMQSETSQAYVAESDGRLLGFVLARTSGPEAEILDVAVLPGVRRRGVARSLLRAVRDAVQRLGVEEIYLEVRESNRAAISLYEGEGYRTVGMRHRYYRNPLENALVLRVALTPCGFSGS